MMVRFSPASEFQPAASERNVSPWFQPAASARLERGKVAQAFFDVTVLAFLALFALLFVCAVGWSIYALASAAAF